MAPSKGQCMFGNHLLGWNVLYHSVGVLYYDTFVAQGLFLKHPLLSQLQAGNQFIFKFLYFLF